MPDRMIKNSCFQCAHFHITHDRKRPYGCSSMGFKSKMLPSREVFALQGHDCLAFKAKVLLPAKRQDQLVNLHL
jgi:hypothetical protein